MFVLSAVQLRLVKAFLVAVILGCVFATIGSAYDGDIIILQPSICQVLEPYGWWWYFWDCGVLPSAR